MQPATDCVVVVVVSPLTCSVHHGYFGVFLPQEGTEIGAPLAELPLPQTWSGTNSKELKSGRRESSPNRARVRRPRREAAGGASGVRGDTGSVWGQRITASGFIALCGARQGSLKAAADNYFQY